MKISEMSKSWTVEQCEFNMIPHDYHHLYRILLVNKENKVTEEIIRKQLLEIVNLYSYEVRNIFNCICTILNAEEEENALTQYYKLATSYLKYGYDGISVCEAKYCTICKINYKENIDSICKSSCHEFYPLGTNGSALCKVCGIKTSDLINYNDPTTLSIGKCLVSHYHNWNIERKVLCTYDDVKSL